MRSGSPLAPACLAVLALASCGGGERQDSNEPAGEFDVRVVRAEFPPRQALARRSELRITVRNEEATRTVPNVAVTVEGFDTRLERSDVADPVRPVFVIDGEPKRIGTFPESKQQVPAGSPTAYRGTWTLGKLGPGRERTFRWTVTAVRAGPYRLAYEVAAGLDGRAKAVGSGGRPPQGTFAGTISGAPPDTRVGRDGRSVVDGVR